MLRFVTRVLLLGIPGSIAGFFLYPSALHAGFAPIFLLVPAMLLDGAGLLSEQWFWSEFAGCQFLYFMVIVGVCKIFEDRRAPPN